MAKHARPAGCLDKQERPAMGCDMVVALGRATVDGGTLFGQNSDRSAGRWHVLRRTAGRTCAADEKVRTRFLELPQARQTFTVLGSQPEGWWGYTHGLNEHALAVGFVPLRSKLTGGRRGLLAADLVRLVLERGRTARAAVDTLTELVERHGQGATPGMTGAEGDAAFLLADPTEAFVVETAGDYWVSQQALEVRAVSNLSTIHQDWDRIARGLAAEAFDQGWWPADGSKVNFADAFAECPIGQGSALRRWGRATCLLEHHNGRIDPALVRRLLTDHYEGTHFEVDPLASLHGPVPLCQHGAAGHATAASFMAQLGPGPDQLPRAWCAFGPPCLSLYLPVFLTGDLPRAYTQAPGGPVAGLAGRMDRLATRLREEPGQWEVLRGRFGALQARLDQEAREFAAEGAARRQRGEHAELARLTTLFLEHAAEQVGFVLDGAGQPAVSAPAAAGGNHHAAVLHS
jgi:secernin